MLETRAAFIVPVQRPKSIAEQFSNALQREAGRIMDHIRWFSLPELHLFQNAATFLVVLGQLTGSGGTDKNMMEAVLAALNPPPSPAETTNRTGLKVFTVYLPYVSSSQESPFKTGLDRNTWIVGLSQVLNPETTLIQTVLHYSDGHTEVIRDQLNAGPITTNGLTTVNNEGVHLWWLDDTQNKIKDTLLAQNGEFLFGTPRLVVSKDPNVVPYIVLSAFGKMLKSSSIPSAATTLSELTGNPRRATRFEMTALNDLEKGLADKFFLIDYFPNMTGGEIGHSVVFADLERHLLMIEPNSYIATTGTHTTLLATQDGWLLVDPDPNNPRSSLLGKEFNNLARIGFSTGDIGCEEEKYLFFYKLEPDGRKRVTILEREVGHSWVDGKGSFKVIETPLIPSSDIPRFISAKDLLATMADGTIYKLNIPENGDPSWTLLCPSSKDAVAPLSADQIYYYAVTSASPELALWLLGFSNSSGNRVDQILSQKLSGADKCLFVPLEQRVGFAVVQPIMTKEADNLASPNK